MARADRSTAGAGAAGEAGEAGEAAGAWAAATRSGKSLSHPADTVVNSVNANITVKIWFKHTSQLIGVSTPHRGF